MKEETLKKIIEDYETEIDDLKKQVADLKEIMRGAEEVDAPPIKPPQLEKVTAPDKKKGWLDI